MNILFVSSGNSVFGISPIVERQGESLSREGMHVEYFTIKGKGIQGYLSNLKTLRQTVRQIQPDILHAHYSLSGVLAAMAGKRPLVVSLMGSDVKSSFLSRILIVFVAKLFWDEIILKSEKMRDDLNIKNVKVIPNGVNIDLFFPMNKKNCQKELNWDIDKKHLLFAAEPARPEKNFTFAQKIFDSMDHNDCQLHYLKDVDPDEMPTWMNAADLVLLTSKWEGSPNVIKEAMACCRPIVSTDVGDVRHLFGDLPGHYIISNEVAEASKTLKEAIEYSHKYGITDGRDRIFELGLDSRSVAKKLIQIYSSLQ